MSLLTGLDAHLCVRTAWTLLHFLWQGAVIALLATGVLWALRRRSASARYMVLLAALGLMAACPPATFLIIGAPAAPVSAVGEASPDLVAERPTPPTSTEPPTAGTATPNSAEFSLAVHESDQSSLAEPTAPATVTPAPLRAAGVTSPATASPWERLSPYLVAGYAVGVLVMFVRLMLGLLGGRRLRSDARPIDSPALLATLAHRARALGLAAAPAMAYCQRVAVPTVVGVLRPMILLPLSLATGLTSEQIEAILTHELAHIRRYDHLLNILQRTIEAVLFFHPAVWFISRQIRIEREHCCDDAVVACGGEPVAYASLLVQIAEMGLAAGGRCRLAATAALAATDGKPSQLRGRVLRLLDNQWHETVRLRRGWPVALTGLAAGLILAASLLGKISAQAAGPDALTTTQPAAASQPTSSEAGVTLDAREVLQKARQAYARSVLDQRNLHIVATLRYDMRSGLLDEWVPTPARRDTWSWYEEPGRPGARLRTDYDPIIGPWSGGARPYCETRYLMAFDGKTTLKIDFSYWDGIYRPSVSDRREGQSPMLSYSSLPTGAELLSKGGDWWDLSIRDLWLAMEKNGVQAEAREVTHAGRSYVELTLTMSPSPRGKATTVLRLDPQRGYSIVLAESLLDGQLQQRREVTDWKQLSPNLWFPTAWTQEYPGRRSRYAATKVEFYDPRQAEAIFTAADVELGKRIVGLPHGPDAPARLATVPQAAPIQASPPETAGSAMSGTWTPAKDGLFIDLDSGKTFTLPADWAQQGMPLASWIRRNGIDACWQPTRNYPKPRRAEGAAIILYDTASVLLNNAGWDSTSDNDIRQQIGGAGPTTGPLAIGCSDEQLPAVMLVKTRNGAVGILRAAPADANAKDSPIQVQYEMLRPEPLNTDQSATQPAAMYTFSAEFPVSNAGITAFYMTDKGNLQTRWTGSPNGEVEAGFQHFSLKVNEGNRDASGRSLGMLMRKDGKAIPVALLGQGDLAGCIQEIRRSPQSYPYAAVMLSDADINTIENAWVDLRSAFGDRAILLVPGQVPSKNRLLELGELRRSTSQPATQPASQPAVRSIVPMLEADLAGLCGEIVLTLGWSGEQVRVPGPLEWPEEGRKTSEYRTWQHVKDVRTLRFTDAAGRRWENKTLGPGVQDITVRRPDGTLLETGSVLLPAGPTHWEFYDATSGKPVFKAFCRAEKKENGDSTGRWNVSNVYTYEPDGTARDWQVRPNRVDVVRGELITLPSGHVYYAAYAEPYEAADRRYSSELRDVAQASNVRVVVGAMFANARDAGLQDVVARLVLPGSSLAGTLSDLPALLKGGEFSVPTDKVAISGDRAQAVATRKTSSGLESRTLHLVQLNGYWLIAAIDAPIVSVATQPASQTTSSSAEEAFTAVSTTDADGRTVDKIDYPFRDDPAVIGVWKRVDFVQDMASFKPGQKHWNGSLFLKDLTFVPKGKMLPPWQSWTRGLVLHSGDRTASRYVIKTIDGAEYMFFEWKSGDYVLGHRKPAYYVLKKESSDVGEIGKGWAALPDDQEWREQFPAKLAKLDINTADLDAVKKVFGEPAMYLWGEKTFPAQTPAKDLPESFSLVYPDQFSVFMTGQKIIELRYERPGYLFGGKLQVGSTLEDVLRVVGQPGRVPPQTMAPVSPSLTRR